MKHSWFTYLLLIFCTLLFMPSYGQRKRENFKENHAPFGGKKKERRNQKGAKVFSKRGGGMFSRKRSGGNADAFATNSMRGKRGFLSSIFGGGNKPRNASLRKTKPGRVQSNEQRQLFNRHRTSGKNRHEKILKKQNKLRGGRRTKGSDVFHHSKRG